MKKLTVDDGHFFGSLQVARMSESSGYLALPTGKTIRISTQENDHELSKH